MKKKDLYSDMNWNISARLAELRKESYQHLSSLPKYSDEARSFEKWRYTLSVWQKQKEEGMVQIVVQAYYRGIFGWGTMMADGFRIQKIGIIREVPQEERYQLT